MSSRTAGLLFTASALVVVSPQALILRMMDLDHWTILLWRGPLMAVGLTLIATIRWRRRAWQRCRAVGLLGILVAATGAVGSIAIVFALIHTSVANALVIVSAAPLFSAVLARVTLAEPVVGGVGVIVAGSLGDDGSSLAGDFAGVLAAVLMAASITLMRRGQEVSMIPAIALSGLISALIAAPFATSQVTQREFLLLVLAGFVILPVAFALFSQGPRSVSAADVALFLPLETVLGSVWVWLVLRESPNATAYLGGSMIIGALVLHSVLASSARVTRSEFMRSPSLAPMSAAEPTDERSRPSEL